jgi:hypothetical protein
MQRPPVIDSGILERELALSIVKGAAATKANELFVVSRRGLDADNLVFCLAVRTAELCYLWHEAIIAPAIDEKTRALKNRQTRLLIGLGLPRRVTGTHHDTGNDVGSGLPGLAVHIGQRDALLPWHLNGICKIGRTVEAD